MGNSQTNRQPQLHLACMGAVFLAFSFCCKNANADYPMYQNSRQQNQYVPQPRYNFTQPIKRDAAVEMEGAKPSELDAKSSDEKQPEIKPPEIKPPEIKPPEIKPSEYKSPESKPASSSFKLQAAVTHSEVLPPLPQTQRLGKVFRGDAPGSAVQRSKNFRVPEWLVGAWLRSEAREVSRVELPSGKKLKPVGNQVARTLDVFGTYRDGKGQAWQIFNPMKATGQVDRGNSMDYHRVHRYDLVITGPKSAVVEVQATHTLVGKADRRIIKVYQDEELNRFTLLADGKAQTDSSVKVFDMRGKPIMLTRTTSSEVRTSRNMALPRINSASLRN